MPKMTAIVISERSNGSKRQKSKFKTPLQGAPSDDLTGTLKQGAIQEFPTLRQLENVKYRPLLGNMHPSDMGICLPIFFVSEFDRVWKENRWK